MSSDIKAPDANPYIIPDPAANGATIRKAFVLEAIANLFSLPIITNTRSVLSTILAHPSRDINPASILLARMLGGIVVGGLTSALLVGATNTRNGIESRRPVYLLLGLGEVALIPLLILDLLEGSGEGAALSQKAAAASVAFLVPPLLWRAYVLFVRPDMFGRYKEEPDQGTTKKRT